MAKADIAIGRRAFEEVLKIAAVRDITLRRATKLMGLDCRTVYFWHNGQAPGSAALQKLAAHGADIYYILLGRRKE